MKNKDLIILGILIILIGGGLFLQEKKYLTTEDSLVLIKTDKTEYEEGSSVKIAIKNNLGKKICFSSCYPYLLEKKENDWSIYSYELCSKPDVNQLCLSAAQSKFFEINLPNVDTGDHRLAVPVCINCKDETNFKEDDRFYSNEFLVE